MTTRQNSTRAPREAPPPGKYGRTNFSGTIFRPILQKERHPITGEKLYRLLYEDGVKGSAVWTLKQLDESGVRWLKRRPRRRT